MMPLHQITMPQNKKIDISLSVVATLCVFFILPVPNPRITTERPYNVFGKIWPWLPAMLAYFNISG